MAKRLQSAHLYELAFVSDPQLSGDGRQAAAVVTRVVADGDEPPRYRGTVHLYDLAGGDSRQLTNGPVTDTNPRFSPDGRQLAYLSVREPGGKPQLYLIALDGGEARALSDEAAGVATFAWDPSDLSLVYLSRSDDGNGADGAPRTITRTRYKEDGVGFLSEAASTLYRRHPDRPAAEALTSFAYPPSEVVVAADGAIYLVAAGSDEEHDAWQRQVWRLSRRGKRRRALLKSADAVGSLAVAPDGNRIAYLAPSVPRDISSPIGVWVLGIDGGRPRLLTGELEANPSLSGDARFGRFPNGPAWSDDGDALVVNLNVEGSSGLARVGQDGSVSFMNPARQAVTAFSAAKGRVAFVAENPTVPGELFVRFKNGRERRLSQHNRAFLERHTLGSMGGPFRAGGDDDAPIGYWTIEPSKPRKDGAVVLQVHGGPHTNYGYGFFFEFHLLAAAGYKVVYGNPRGSSSFGHRFAAALHGAYGSIDADDVMAIADHALAHHHDPEAPLHLTGGSYGGFMTNWLVGHSRRFRSAVTQRSISNWLSFYGSSDIGYRFTVQQLAGTPWADTELLWQQSPLRYVAEVVTPLLILHSEQDHRCPIEQAEQLFVALKALGRAETAFVRFPEEGHELSRSGRPDRRVARLDALLDWFEKHP